MTTPARTLLLGACALAAAAVTLTRLVPIVGDQLAVPFDLISEGPHLTLITAIRDGFDIYAPAARTAPPFQIVPYVPLFHALVAWLPADPANPFFTGRLLAMLFMLGAAATLFAIAPPRRWLGVPLIACACFFLIRPVTGNTAYLRSDSAGLFFSAVAIVALARRPPTLATAVLAGLSCALAVACKQSFLAASAACGLFLLMRSGRLTLAFIAAEAALLGILAAAATITWGSGFWYCILLPTTQYPRDWPSFFVHWQDMLKQPVFAWILLLAGLTSLATLVRAPAALFTTTPYFSWILLSFAVQSSALSGIGASNHYFFEPVLACLLWLVWCSGAADGWRHRDRVTAAALALLAVGIASELTDTVPEEYRYTTPERTERRLRERTRVVAEMQRLGIPPGPVLNLKNSTVTFDYPGTMNVNDPYLFGVLWEMGALDNAPLVRAIEARYYDAVFVAPGLFNADNQLADHPVQHVLRVLFLHYQLTIRGDDVNVLTRRAPPSQ